MSRSIKVSDLKDQIGVPGPHTKLRCPKCGDRWSADSGDYWQDEQDRVLKCKPCRVNMQLVIERTVFEQVKP